MRWLVAALVLSGCWSVAATRVDDGLYVVDVQGNAFWSPGEVLAEAYKAASRLCPHGFTVVNGTNTSTSSFVRTAYGVQQMSKPQTAIVVRCDRSPPLLLD